MFKATVSAATVINRVWNFGLVSEKGKLGSRPHSPTQFFWEYPREERTSTENVSNSFSRIN